MSLRATIALLCLLLLAPTAHARPPHRPTHPHGEAMTLARTALDAFLRRDFAAASRLYTQAAALEPDVAEFVFGAARAEQEAGQMNAARSHFARVLVLTDDAHPLHARAAAAASALQPQPVAVAVVPVTPKPAPLPETPVSPPEVVTSTGSSPAAVVLAPAPLRLHSAPLGNDWRRPARWTAATVGVSAAAVAIGLAVSAASAQGQLDSHKMADGRYDLLQVSYADAVSRQGSINSRWTWSAVVGSAAVAALFAAGWWLWGPAPHSDGPTMADNDLN